jgi:pyruvate/2-oxoglutarate dehydrogenase complex dihydrolipoamide acyltransferase (E2) component
MDVILPKWGMTMQEATVTGWLKAVGDQIDKGDELVEVETDKVNVAVEAPVAGVLTKRCVEVGDVVEVGHVIAVIEDAP